MLAVDSSRQPTLKSDRRAKLQRRATAPVPGNVIGHADHTKPEALLCGKDLGSNICATNYFVAAEVRGSPDDCISMGQDHRAYILETCWSKYYRPFATLTAAGTGPKWKL
ncbi:uncharacterized protein PV07_04387 [Cladophialophora immunda]|uniref:Uncharacterized protein n=1 Tax=Cladophialophora immunda TaxID=569365 RepID=A0A0D2DAZ2_9EURO|nr:uncharacterized protein PV07_04387 [Cladophialophora immunda]KIW32874.1 hypothetical protein PV07_04387 [Cladophialophora immunda]